VPGIEARNAKIRERYARGDISQRELARRFELSRGYVWKLLRERRA
jgi:transcriptional regulator with XRE-family HTH domain